MNDRKHRRNTVSTIYLKFKRATYQPRLTSSVDAILFVYKLSVNGGQWCHPALLFRLALILNFIHFATLLFYSTCSCIRVLIVRPFLKVKIPQGKKTKT